MAERRSQEVERPADIVDTDRRSRQYIQEKSMPGATVRQQFTIPARPEPFNFAPAETALIVVDMQNGFLSKGGYLDLVGIDVSPAAKATAATQAVIYAAPDAGLEIIYLQNGF